MGLANRLFFLKSPMPLQCCRLHVCSRHVTCSRLLIGSAMVESGNLGLQCLCSTTTSLSLFWGPHFCLTSPYQLIVLIQLDQQLHFSQLLPESCPWEALSKADEHMSLIRSCRGCICRKGSILFTGMLPGSWHGSWGTQIDKGDTYLPI